MVSSTTPQVPRGQISTKLDSQVTGITASWILAHHDAWSRATLSNVYSLLTGGALLPSQFNRWLADRTCIARALVAACSRIKDALGPHTAFPAAVVASEETTWLNAYADSHGLLVLDHSSSAPSRTGLSDAVGPRTEANNQAQSLPEVDSAVAAATPIAPPGPPRIPVRPSYEAGRVVELLENSTVPSASVAVSVTAVWCFLMTSWQAFSLSRRNANPPSPDGHPTHVHLRGFLSRDTSLIHIVETQSILDSFLKVSTSPAELGKAEKTFEELLARSIGTLDRALEHEDVRGQVPLCAKCGRKGHVDERCTFKSHV